MIDALIWFLLGVVACAFAGAAFSERVRAAVGDLWSKLTGWFRRGKTEESAPGDGGPDAGGGR